MLITLVLCDDRFLLREFFKELFLCDSREFLSDQIRTIWIYLQVVDPFFPDLRPSCAVLPPNVRG
ncbi:MAG TPA: hypothetical protein V6D08_03725 [Candidatus Obscuribacterales bacterium]